MVQSTGLKQAIKQVNRQRICNLLREKRVLAKQDIAYQLQLSLPTISQDLTDLMNLGIIDNSGVFQNTGGRNATAFSFVSNARVALGLDITRNHVTLVVVDLDGTVVYRARVHLPFSTDEGYFRQLGDLVKTTLQKTEVDETRLLGVGIGVPGLITADHQAVYYGTILDFTDVTAADFERFIPYPCLLFNDADAAGLSEIWASRDNQHAFYISLSNNVGGSVLVDHTLYGGQNHRAGEVGHLTVHPDGPACYCGRHGCLEVYCSAQRLAELTDGNLGAFFEQLKQGNAAFRERWDAYLDVLAIAVSDVRMLFDGTIVLGGYVGSYMDDYIDDLRARVALRDPFSSHADYVQICRYKTEAIAAGGAIYYIDRFLNNI